MMATLSVLAGFASHRRHNSTGPEKRVSPCQFPEANLWIASGWQTNGGAEQLGSNTAAFIVSDRFDNTLVIAQE